MGPESKENLGNYKYLIEDRGEVHSVVIKSGNFHPAIAIVQYYEKDPLLIENFLLYLIKLNYSIDSVDVILRTLKLKFELPDEFYELVRRKYQLERMCK